ncbi:MAG: hypothetical protein PHO07_10255, partial [Pirellulales bacterium]|nr:hypothetical protein [Pirellulales bacterium]
MLFFIAACAFLVSLDIVDRFRAFSGPRCSPHIQERLPMINRLSTLLAAAVAIALLSTANSA